MEKSRIRVLIGDDTLEYGKAYANSLKQKSFATSVVCKDGLVIFEEIKNSMPDVVILDLSLPHLDAIEIIKKMKESAYKIPIFIVLSSYDCALIEKQVIEAGASAYFLKPFDINMLSNRIVSLYNIKHNIKYKNECEIYNGNDFEKFVTDYICKLGISAKLKGYYYVREAVISLVNKPYMLQNISKSLYESIAKKHDCTSQGVNKAIQTAVNNAMARGNCEVIKDFFGYCVDGSTIKTTNREFLLLLSDKIRLEYKKIAC